MPAYQRAKLQGAWARSRFCAEQDGRCKTLDASADGYMRGEGCIVHLLEAFEPEELAVVHLADQAVVLHGTAVNQDGRSSSLTVRIPLRSLRISQETVSQLYRVRMPCKLRHGQFGVVTVADIMACLLKVILLDKHHLTAFEGACRPPTGHRSSKCSGRR